MDLSIQNIGLFVLAGWALNLTLGPDVFYIVTHALKSGWRAGAVAAAGITAGCFVHVAAATIGLSALITASSAAFTVVKWIGAAYLVFVGWQMLRSKPVAFHIPAPLTDINSPKLIANYSISSSVNHDIYYKNIFLNGLDECAES